MKKISNFSTIHRFIGIMAFVLTTIIVQAQVDYVDRVRDNDNGVDGLQDASDIIVSPNGMFLYSAGPAEQSGNGEIGIFSINQENCSLAYIGTFNGNNTTGFEMITSFALSPDGSHLYALSGEDPELGVFSVNGDGTLSFFQLESLAAIGNAIAISPNGSYVYIAQEGSNQIQMFSRNSGSGDLTLMQTLFGLNGLADVRDIIIDPSGSHLYSVTPNDNGKGAIGIFSIGGGGILAYAGIIRDNEPPSQGIDDLMEIAISPDGLFIYAAGTGDNSVTVYSRNPGTGLLSWVQQVQDGVGGDQGVDAVNSVAVSADGDLVFTTSATEDKLAIFARDAGTGMLTLLETEEDFQECCPDGLNDAYMVIASAIPLGNCIFTLADEGNVEIGIFFNQTRYIPTLSQWGIILLMILMSIIGLVMFRTKLSSSTEIN